MSLDPKKLADLQNIPLKNIRENPVALRPVDRESEKYLGLVDSVKQWGVLNPIGVRPIPNPDPNSKEQLYSVTDGLHRFTAAQDAGLEVIGANIQSFSDAEVEEAQMIANMHKVETTPAQYSKQLNRIVLRNPDLTLAEIASRLNRSADWLSDRLSLVKLSEAIQEFVDDGRIKLGNAIALATLPPEEQQNFLERAMTQATGDFVPAVNTAVKAIKDALREGRDPNAKKEFIHTPKLLKPTDIKEAIVNYKVLAQELIALAQPQTPGEIFKLGLEYCLRSDPRSIAQAKAKWEADEAESKRKKEQAKAEREELKKLAAQKAIDAMQSATPSVATV